MDKVCDLCEKSFESVDETQNLCDACSEEMLRDLYGELLPDEEADYFIQAGLHDIGDQ